MGFQGRFRVLLVGKYKTPSRQKNKNPNNFRVAVLKQVSKTLYCDKVWENRIFLSCIGIGDRYSKPLLSFRLLQNLRLLSRQIISFVHRGYFSEHQVKTCLKNTSPRKCSEILTIPGVHLVILPLHSSPDRVFLHRSRCGDRNFPSTLYKSNTVRNHCIFADWSFWETFSSGVLKNNLGVQKIKFVSTTDEGFAEVWNLSFQQNSYRRWQSSRCQNF